MIKNKEKIKEKLKESKSQISGIIENLESNYYENTNKINPEDAIGDVMYDIASVQDYLMKIENNE